MLLFPMYIPILALDEKTGWLNTEVRKHTEMIRFWNRIIKMDTTRLTRKVFETDYRIYKNNWCSEIKQLFEKVNSIDIYHNKHTCDIHEMQISLHKVFTDQWLNDIQLKPKLRTYILLKNKYSTEEYVTFCRPRQDRSLLAQIRSGPLPLHVETSRFRDTKVENRTLYDL